jgi:GntR family transcriptional regulator
MALLIRLNKSDPRPIYAQIAEEIRGALVAGLLLPDDPLPSVRELAGKLAVNPNTVKQAYRELEREGVVYVRRGEGTFARRWGQNAAARKRIVDEIVGNAMNAAKRYNISLDELAAEILKASRRTKDSARRA